MADERDEQATQVGNEVIDEGGDAEQTAVGAAPPGGAQQTAVHQAPPATDTPAAANAEVFFTGDQAQQEPQVPTPPPPQPRDESERGGASPAEADRIPADREDAFAEKPHLYALGAFAGAFLLAQVLKRLTGGDDE